MISAAVQPPANALQSIANVLNHRFKSITEQVNRPPLLSYAEIQTQLKTPDAAKALNQCVENFKVVASRAASLRQLPQATEHDRQYSEVLEKASKKNAVVVGLLGKVSGYEVTLEVDALFPNVVTLTAVKQA